MVLKQSSVLNIFLVQTIFYLSISQTDMKNGRFLEGAEETCVESLTEIKKYFGLDELPDFNAL